MGMYEEHGIRINREPFGPLTGTLIPPFISHSIAIIEGLLALEQGVKSITVGYGQVGSLTQDVAAIQSLRELAHEYFQNYGYTDYELSTVFHQWMGGFPEDESKAFAIISWVQPSRGCLVPPKSSPKALTKPGNPDCRCQHSGAESLPPDAQHGQ